ncbi:MULTISPECIES: Cof-type HAD-IIB family hydrolase [unclassified Paenibacillus]|uniref:Cof-type HAD-IIB family hydrolase n=1 Tax=unclassified Paenibacillus TaxID=185978 RepID=UPI001AE5E885|nr:MULTISPECIES: Cof-type HAD-IIB family hydrolase [unclassified Paenibacillus]MBP1154351.1 HAD superfamily hydrolase (TIGR01484 family) [Paenibacillus sp. PvP091]MBP1170265.1 HAD superfamily hydrolase (TIGR01484 family) [Paenibacillus sp. PvR098]MBP2441293.1 HAD superfamily hydrolase (TIGR01484 family) [Paenibacillus sp. PvP052]
MSHYKLIALDLDGTLLTDDKHISEENKAAIRLAEDAGVTVMFATGRGVQNVEAYIEELGLRSPLVTVNGSEVWKEPGVLLERHVVAPELIRRMHALAVYYDTWFWAYCVGDIYNKERWVPESELDAKQWLKFGYFTENVDSLAVIRQELASWNLLEITNSHPWNLELNPKGVSKASGLHQVCRLLGIEMSQVIAMGDSLNDVAMIREAGLGVAMGNAQDEVKALADIVTLTNEENGVAKVIRQYALK